MRVHGGGSPASAPAGALSSGPAVASRCLTRRGPAPSRYSCRRGRCDAVGPVHRALARPRSAGRAGAAGPTAAAGARRRRRQRGVGGAARRGSAARSPSWTTAPTRSPRCTGGRARPGCDELVTPVQGDVDALADVVPAGGADLVLGHGLLEVVDDAAAAVVALAAAAAPGGAVSVLVAGRYAAVLGRTLGGRLAEARALLTDPRRPVRPGRPAAQAARRRALRGAARRGAGSRWSCCRATACSTAGCPARSATAGPAAARAVAELEALAAGAAPLREVAARLHALARRPVPDRPARRPAGSPGRPAAGERPSHPSGTGRGRSSRVRAGAVRPRSRRSVTGSAAGALEAPAHTDRSIGCRKEIDPSARRVRVVAGPPDSYPLQ